MPDLWFRQWSEAGSIKQGEPDVSIGAGSERFHGRPVRQRGHEAQVSGSVGEEEREAPRHGRGFAKYQNQHGSCISRDQARIPPQERISSEFTDLLRVPRPSSTAVFE